MLPDKTLTIIPAKGQSRRIHGKNLALLNGKPLVVHTIEQAVASGVCGEICVGTDDEYIAEIAKKTGASVPFLRRDDVDDITPVGVAAVNILKRYKKKLGKEFEYVCLLLTTSPLRIPEDIIGCRDVLMFDSSLDAAMSFVFSEKHPYWAWEFDSSKHIKPMFPDKCDSDRHELSKPYYVDGAVYWAKADFFEKVNGNQYRGKIGGYVMPTERAVDVDVPVDLAFCEFLLEKNRQ